MAKSLTATLINALTSHDNQLQQSAIGAILVEKIALMNEAGSTDEQIMTELVTNYGNFILAWCLLDGIGALGLCLCRVEDRLPNKANRVA